MNKNQMPLEGKTSEDAIKVFELFLEVGLPKFYRKCLLNQMSDFPRGCYESLNKDNESIVHHRYFINSGNISTELIYAFKSSRNEIPEPFLPIADDPFGNSILLGLKGSYRDKVYFWDHEVDLKENWDPNTALIANSFEDFINSIHDEEE